MYVGYDMNTSMLTIFMALVCHPFTKGSSLLKSSANPKNAFGTYIIGLIISYIINLLLEYNGWFISPLMSTYTYPGLVKLAFYVCGFLLILVYGWIFSKIAKALGGEGAFNRVITVFLYMGAYSSILISVIFAFNCYASFIGDGILYMISTILYLGFGIWTIILALKLIGRQMNFSAWKALGGLILTHLTVSVVAGCIGYVVTEFINI